MAPGVNVDTVAGLIHEVALSVVLPRWRNLASDEVEEKSPGEVVTVIDREAEQILTHELRRLLPGSVVVGEEATTGHPGLLELVSSAPNVWLVDPLDGTANYVAGSPDFAVMVALVRAGVTVASWIDRPADRATYVAEKGSGAFANGQRLRREPQPAGLDGLRGAALTRLLNEHQRSSVVRLGELVETLGPGRVCAGVDYPLIAEGGQDFVLFMRSLPWDHAPGALILCEAGGQVSHLDGEPYAPGSPRRGLLASCDQATQVLLTDALRQCGYSTSNA
jgi:fructose-1,6-bisphosphatase/inositol monophosphatase family enzyme